VWSPDGEWILFDSSRDGVWNLYLIRPDGTGEHRLTHRGATTQTMFARHPSWSPDGKRIAFDSDRDGDEEIYVMDADGSNVVRLTISPGRDTHAAWTPDGRELTFGEYARRRMRRSIVVACLGLAIVGTVGQPELSSVMRDRALRLRAGLKKAQVPFESAERMNWHYVPRPRRGVALQELSPEQKASLDQLLHAGLSDDGFTKAKGVVVLEPILGGIEGSDFRDPGQYFFTLFGDPASPPWGWRFEGHHLSLNYTVTPSEIRTTPEFFGANPARVPSGPRAGWRLLHDEEDLGWALVNRLSADQRKRAILSTRAPADLITGADREVRLAHFEGLPASAMSEQQRDLLMRVVRTYVGNAANEIAEREMEKIRQSGIDRLYFAWAGGTQPGQPHYYRVHGPTILIELDNTQDDANHIHSVWRAPGGDFAEDLLRKHYAESPHHRGHRP
jgi:hypothetical protein